MAEKTIYVIETHDAEYTFDFEEVHDVTVAPGGVLVVEGADGFKVHAFAPGVWVRWYLLEQSSEEQPS